MPQHTPCSRNYRPVGMMWLKEKERSIDAAQQPCRFPASNGSLAFSQVPGIPPSSPKGLPVPDKQVHLLHFHGRFKIPEEKKPPSAPAAKGRCESAPHTRLCCRGLRSPHTAAVNKLGRVFHHIAEQSLRCGHIRSLLPDCTTPYGIPYRSGSEIHGLPAAPVQAERRSSDSWRRYRKPIQATHRTAAFSSNSCIRRLSLRSCRLPQFPWHNDPQSQTGVPPNPPSKNSFSSQRFRASNGSCSFLWVEPYKIPAETGHG